MFDTHLSSIVDYVKLYEKELDFIQKINININNITYKSTRMHLFIHNFWILKNVLKSHPFQYSSSFFKKKLKIHLKVNKENRFLIKETFNNNAHH